MDERPGRWLWTVLGLVIVALLVVVIRSWVETTGRRLRGASAWLGLKLHARHLALVDDLEIHLGDGACVA